MTFFKFSLKKFVILLVLSTAVITGFVSCGDRSPSAGQPGGDSLPAPYPGDSTTGRDSLRVKKWATVYITSKEGFDSKEVQDRIDSAKNFYRRLVVPFNQGKPDAVVLGFRNMPPIVKDNGESVFVLEVYAHYTKACDPCTVPSTRPPYPRISRTDHDIDD